MRRFVINILLFALILAVTLAAGELLVRNDFNSYKYKDQYVRSHGQAISTLILGDSHNYYNISAAELGDSAFNLANVSQNYEYDFRLLEQYLPILPHLHTVILSMSYGSLRVPDFEHGEVPFYASNYKMYMDIDKHSDFSLYNFEIAWPEIYSGRVRRAIFGGRGGCDSLGQSTNNVPSDYYKGWTSRTAAFAVEQTISDTTQVAQNVYWLDRICKLCHTHGIRTVLVTTPLYIEYRRHMDPEQSAEMKRVSAMMQRRYGTVCLDYMADKRFTFKDFYDGDHLLRGPATRRLSNLIRADMQ